jgi:hypothetical protein
MDENLYEIYKMNHAILNVKDSTFTEDELSFQADLKMIMALIDIRQPEYMERYSLEMAQNSPTEDKFDSVS